MAAADTEHQPIGRVFATFDFSAQAEEWLQGQASSYSEDEGRAFLREYSGNWADELVEGFSEEFQQLNLPIQVEIQQTVDGSLLHILVLVWDAAKQAWPFIRDGLETIETVRTIIDTGRRVMPC
jgi:hypothetical protein